MPLATFAFDGSVSVIFASVVTLRCTPFGSVNRHTSDWRSRRNLRFTSDGNTSKLLAAQTGAAAVRTSGRSVAIRRMVDFLCGVAFKYLFAMDFFGVVPRVQRF